MSIAKPNFLHSYSQTSGTTITNYGSTNGNYVIQQGSSGTNWNWLPNGGIYTGGGAYQSVTGQGSSMGYASTSATAPSSVLVDINFMVAFTITALNSTGSRDMLIGPNSLPTNGDAYVEAIAPAGGGNYDLHCTFTNAGAGNNISVTFSALTFSTNHILAMSCNVATATAVATIFQVDTGAAQQPATANWNTQTWNATWPFHTRRNDFTNYYGLRGSLFAWAYQRGASVAWNTTDINNICTNGPTVIPGWPLPPSSGFVEASYISPGIVGPC